MQRGNLIAQLPGFREARSRDRHRFCRGDQVSAKATTAEELFAALSLGRARLFAKCGFNSAVLGLSGGIDSAVTAVIAARMRSGRKTLPVSPCPASIPRAAASTTRARSRAISASTFSRFRSRSAFAVFKAQFTEIFAGLPEDTTEENMQPRLRGMILMALSNNSVTCADSTGNKSELAVGYCTIYGDMAGGLAVISDVPKTMIYELARWINREHARSFQDRRSKNRQAPN